MNIVSINAVPWNINDHNGFPVWGIGIFFSFWLIALAGNIILFQDNNEGISMKVKQEVNGHWMNRFQTGQWSQNCFSLCVN